jgi:hypothetical protein
MRPFIHVKPVPSASEWKCIEIESCERELVKWGKSKWIHSQKAVGG